MTTLANHLLQASPGRVIRNQVTGPPEQKRSGCNLHLYLMKRQVIALVTSSFAVMLFAGCQTAHTRAKAWEYKVVSARVFYQGHPEAGLEQRLSRAAAEGWEVVSSSSDDGCPVVILRKPK